MSDKMTHNPSKDFPELFEKKQRKRSFRWDAESDKLLQNEAKKDGISISEKIRKKLSEV